MPLEGTHHEVHDHDVWRARPGLGPTLASRSPEWIKGTGEVMMSLQGEMEEAGELVSGYGLVDPIQAKVVRFDAGAPVSTDGPYAEIKESLAG